MLAFDQGDLAAALDLLEPFDGGDQGHGAAGQAPMTSSRRRDTVATWRPPFGAEPHPSTTTSKTRIPRSLRSSGPPTSRAADRTIGVADNSTARIP